MFEIAIQTGAMFAVIWEYRERLRRTVAGLTHDPVAQRFARNVLIAFVPAVVFGPGVRQRRSRRTCSTRCRWRWPSSWAASSSCGSSAATTALYGERDLEGRRHARVETVDDMSALDALKVGLLQCLALIPGTSRSGATIIGAHGARLLAQGATEFSFYLGIPTLMGAGAYSVWKERAALQWADLPMFAVGLVFAFVSALLCIRWLIRYVSTHDFTVFAWYRIVFGGIVLLTAYTGLAGRGAH